VLVIGHGGIGTRVASRLLPFEVEVVRVARTARQEDGLVIHGIGELPRLIPQADVVVIAVPLSDETTHLVDAGFLASMKKGALLVNVSRGAVVDTDALVNALTENRVNAALDVTDPEPPPAGHPLWAAPNLLLSPHAGGSTSAMAPRIGTLIRTQVARLLAGEEPVGIVRRGRS